MLSTSCVHNTGRVEIEVGIEMNKRVSELKRSSASSVPVSPLPEQETRQQRLRGFLTVKLNKTYNLETLL